MMNILRPKLKLVKGTRFVSFLFIGCSVLIAAGILFAANMYYNIDTGEIVMEEIQRVTGTLRATASLIVGGTDTQDPTAGYVFEVVGSTRLGTTTVATGTLELIAADQLLRFSGGTSYDIGFKAPTTVTSSKTYILPQHGADPPAADHVLTWQTGDQMTWKSIGGAGGGDIDAVGDVTGGAAFTTSTVAGTSLWFHNSSHTGELTIGTLAADATYTLPDLTGTIALTSGGLGTGGVLFANSGLIATSSNFTWDNTNRYFKIGSAGNDGQLWIYSATSSYLGFAATSTMTTSTTYYWPANYGSADDVLTTDATGNLTWSTVEGVGGVTGTGVDGRVTYWTGTSTVASDADFTWDAGTNMLTLGGGLISSLIQSTGALTLEALSGNILLNPSTGIVQLATSTYIRTHGGYEIGATGTQILVEMIPILGFDLPVQTATTSYVKVSKDLENYPFQSASTGTTRVHKLVFRYAASSTNLIDWRISTSTGQTYSSSTLATTTSNNLEKGNAYVTTTTIPTDGTDWWLDIKTNTVSDVVRVFQIFLAAYDEIQ